MSFGNPSGVPRDIAQVLLARRPARVDVSLARGPARGDISLARGDRRGGLGRLAAGAIWLAAGCGGSQPASSTSLAGASQGQIAAGAAVTAIAAGAVWAAGGGCRLQGCPYGSYCNQKSGYCDVRRCDEGCPDGTVCNEGLGRCQASPPPAPPNDFLPQDDKRRPPGS